MADDFPAAKRPTMALEGRVKTANDLLIAQLGAVTHVERRNGGFVILGAGCPRDHWEASVRVPDGRGVSPGNRDRARS
jgi:hypothetical protein